MKALLCTREGGPDDLSIGDLPDPVAGPGQALVRVEAAALNFFDLLIIAGKYQYKPELPFSPGAELAGTIERLGPGVSDFTVGDRVIGYAISQNKKSFVALFPSNAYGGVVEAEFNQVVAKRGGRVVLVEHYSEDRKTLGEMVKQVAQAAGRGDALFIPDQADSMPSVASACAAGRRALRTPGVEGAAVPASGRRCPSPRRIPFP